MKIVKIAILGCGAIGSEVAVFIDKELKGKAQVSFLCDQDMAKAQALRERISSSPLVLDIDAMVNLADLIVEAASIAAAEYILNKLVDYKKDAVILSVGALLDKEDILKKLDGFGVRIYVPSGAICGVDGVGAFSLSDVKSISLITSKPPAGLKGANFLKQNNISLDAIQDEKIIFKGSVQSAIKCFPRNINVAAILYLAANGKNVEVCIKANPNISRNKHRIEIESAAGRISVDVENVPSSVNPKTSTLAILSTQYLLKKMFSSLRIGS